MADQATEIKRIEKAGGIPQIDEMELKNDLRQLCLGLKNKIKSPDMKVELCEQDRQKLLLHCYETLDWIDEHCYETINEIIQKHKETKELFEKVTTEANYTTKIKRADKLFDEKKFKEADLAYNDIIEHFGADLSDKNKTYLMLQRALVLHNLKFYRECIKLLNGLMDAIQRKDTENYLKATRIRALTHYKLKNFKNCILDIDAVLTHKTDDVLDNLKKTAKEQFTDLTMKNFQEAVQLTNNKRFVQSNFLLNDLIINADFNFLAVEDPTLKGKVYTLSAKNYFKLKNYKQAVEACNFAEKNSRNDVEIWDIQTESYLQQGLLSEGIFGIQALETVESFNKDRLNDLKAILEGKRFEKVTPAYDGYFQTKKYQLALDSLKQVEVDKLSNELKLDYFCKQADALHKLKKYHEGARICDKALAIDKDYARAIDLKRSIQEVIDAYNQMIIENPWMED